jgi:hypothetical protein
MTEQQNDDEPNLGKALAVGAGLLLGLLGLRAVSRTARSRKTSGLGRAAEAGQSARPASGMSAGSASRLADIAMQGQRDIVNNMRQPDPYDPYR